MSVTEFDTSRLLAQVARDLAAQPSLGPTFERIVEMAAKLTGCNAALVWTRSPGGVAKLKGATDPELGRELDSILTRTGEGMMRQALAARSIVHMPDLHAETRWPRYTAAVKARQLPIGSAIAYPLELGEQPGGVLALYAGEPGHFGQEIIALGGVLAEHAGIALKAATLADLNHHLRIALSSNRRIGIAIGVLMAMHHLTEQQAFDVLRTASQHTHTKLHAVAEEVILTGAAPTWRTSAS